MDLSNFYPSGGAISLALMIHWSAAAERSSTPCQAESANEPLNRKVMDVDGLSGVKVASKPD